MNSSDDFVKQKLLLNYNFLFTFNYLNNAKICYNMRIINIKLL